MTLEQVLSWAANLIEVGSFVFVIVLFWRARRELRNYLNQLTGTISARPIALVVGLGDDISGSVQQYLQDEKLQMPLEVYTHKGLVPRDQFYRVLTDPLKIKSKLTQAGVTEVHLFYRGPVTLAMAIGAIMDNWVPVKVYEYSAGNYKMDLVLQKETVRGLLTGKIVSEGEEMVNELANSLH